MEIYLIRHGIAAERGEYSQDEERPLTPKGQEKTKKVAQRLLEIGINFDLILTSPLVRAQQTAAIFQEVGLSKKILTFPDLKPEGKLENWLNWWQESGYNNEDNKLALVGHEPDLGQWIELLIWGEIADKLIVKKAGIIGLKLPVNVTPIGKSELFLLTSPKWLIS
jgi:phosphohistidine phosphatase